MKATKIYYKKLVNLGNFQNEEIGIEIEVEEGEKAQDVLEKAKEFVENNTPGNEKRKRYEEAVRILDNPNRHSYVTVMESKEIVNQYEKELKEADDLPF